MIDEVNATRRFGYLGVPHVVIELYVEHIEVAGIVYKTYSYQAFNASVNITWP